MSTTAMSRHESRDTARDALRVATAGIHEALHRQADLAALAAGRMEIADYCRLMARIAGFYVWLDPMMSGASARLQGEIGGYRYAPRLPLLATFGQGQTGCEVAPAAARAEAAARIDHAEAATPAGFAGLAYVVDGAVLGGASIARAVGPQDFPDAMTAYWRWCRIEGPGQWRAARALVGAADTGPAARDGMIGSAGAGFAAFAAAVAGPGSRGAPGDV